MSRKRKNTIDAIVNMAESEGLSYGRYVAREREVHIQHRPPIADTAKPRGMSTIQAALRVDCPRLCAKVMHSEQPAPRPPVEARHENGRTDEATIPYKRKNAGRSGLSAEMIVRIRALRAQGMTHRNIAFECDISLSSVKKHLKEDKS